MYLMCNDTFTHNLQGAFPAENLIQAFKQSSNPELGSYDLQSFPRHYYVSHLKF